MSLKFGDEFIDLKSKFRFVCGPQLYRILRHYKILIIKAVYNSLN